MIHAFVRRAARLSLWVLPVLALHATTANAALTDLAAAPLETSTAQLVKPNIMYVLDDSGSMGYDFLPDWAKTSNVVLGRNSGYNGQYYNPAITYTPPLKYDLTNWGPMTADVTSNWTAVPYDGFGVQTATADDGNRILTTTSSGATQNLVGSAYYYTFIPGEYCSAANLRTCVTQSAASTAYPYAAILRWCNTATDCQASRIDSGTKQYTTARYPGASSTGTITFGGSGSTSLTGVTVNGAQIMNAATSNQTSTSALATAVAAAINACTTAVTGNCAIAGYKATASGSKVTITTPATVGGIEGTSAVVAQSGTMTSTVAAFTGGTPGQIIRTDIVSTTTSYVYPNTTTKAATRTDCVLTTCTYEEEMTNYANYWAYYRSRMQSTKSAASLAFSVLSNNFRLGYMSINNNTGTDFLNIGDLTTGSGGQRQAWYTKFTSAKPSNSTPLKKALSTAGRYYAGSLYNSRVNGVTAGDPMQYACQRNYTILSTDGYWNNDSTPTGVNGVAIGDVDSDESRPQFDGTATSNTLADVTEYYYKTDIRSSTFNNATNKATGVDVANNAVPDQQQRMITSTVGLGASGFMLYEPNYATSPSGDFNDVAQGTLASPENANAGICIWQTSGACNWPVPVNNTQTTIDDLWHAAVNGRGNYYSAKNPADLQAGLTSFLQTVTAATANSAGATVSNPNVTPADNLAFQVSFKSVAWYGELARYTIDPNTGLASTAADWSQSGTAPSNTGTPITYTAPLLDQMAWTSRTIFTFDPGNASTRSRPFAWESMTTDMQNMFKVAAINTLSQFCSTGTNCLPQTSQVDGTTAGTTTGAGGINLVNFLRGDRRNEGIASTSYYFLRTHVLGDIVNSQAVYVKNSTNNYADAGYAAFKNTNLTRQGTVYVGANDGMLHAFNADNGSETWAYIPSMVIPSLYKLADRNYGSMHSYFVDATPAAGDVYFDNAWHTMLVGGLGLGGRGFYALDVTTPSSPKVLWEFSSDTSKTGLTTDADLGYSFGTPLFTKLSDGTWAVLVTSGYNNVSPGSGHGVVWVLNAKTGAVISKMDTNAGSTGVATGCAAAPCPSGLTKIYPYIESAVTNNQALRVYGGDLFGNLWRFDISSLTAAGGTPSVKLLATLTDPNGARQPITARPEVGFSNGAVMVYVGTGQYLGLSDVSNTQVQSIYGIKDATSSGTSVYGAPRAATCGATLTSACFVQQQISASDRSQTSTVSYPINLGTMNGWYVDLPLSGERANVDPVLQLGTLAFATNVPSSTSACSTGGSSYAIYFDYKTGLAVPRTLVTGGLILYGSTSALTSGITLIGANGNYRLYAQGSGGQLATPQAPIQTSGLGTRRISWRELVSGQ